MTEAVTRLLDEAFMEWNIPRLRVAHFKENLASQRVIEKLGFTYVKDGHYEATLLGKIFEERKYVLTKEDYVSRSKSEINSGS